MDNLKQIKNELEETFKSYLNVYFVARDMDATFALMSDGLSGFGTGINEKAYSGKAFKDLYKRDFQQAPNPIAFTLNKYKVQLLSECVGLVYGELDITTSIMDQNIKFNKLRISTVFTKKESKWYLEHMHISFPTDLHEADESYPLMEIEDRATLLEKMVQERTRELENTRKKLEEISETDSMTKIYNRMKLDQVLQTEIQRANRYNSTFSVILFDIDDFKSINDTYGHQKGDQVLSELASVVHKRIRNTDIVGRWGGDEFMTISPETTKEDAILLAETMRITIAAFDFGIQGSVTSSFGVTAWQSQDSYNALMDRVDKSLYKAKLNGKNQVVT